MNNLLGLLYVEKTIAQSTRFYRQPCLLWRNGVLPRKMGMQEREMFINPKEGTDDTVVHPVNPSMLYLSITLLKPSAFKRSPNLSPYRNNCKFTKEEHE